MTDKIDVIDSRGSHYYWSTHCRHGNHNDCKATELAPGVPRRPAQCKICTAPCNCNCHQLNEHILLVQALRLFTDILSEEDLIHLHSTCKVWISRYNEWTQKYQEEE